MEAGAADQGASAFLYDAERTDRPVRLRDVATERLTAKQLLWIDVPFDEDLPPAVALELTPETVEALRAPSSEPSLFVYEGYVHVVVIAAGRGPKEHESTALHCVVGSNWVLTVHRQPIEFLDHFDERIRGDSDLGKIDGNGFLAAILHEHVASYLAELRPLEAELDRLDVRSMRGRVQEETLLRELIGTRVRVAKLRRQLEPHRELYALLSRSEFAVLSGSHSASDFEALTEFLERALQAMETMREMIAGSFEIYTTWTAHATNNVMKRLTVASVTLLPPTLLAGIMGMNSLPTTFANGAAFWVTTALMTCLAVTVLAIARLRDWI